jgi:hypothetical protein
MGNTDFELHLENTVKTITKPLREIPFPVVIKALTGRQVLSIDKDSKNCRELLQRLATGVSMACKNARKVGIQTRRPNEVGNRIEPFVREALTSMGMVATVPITRSGRPKKFGYPDIFIKDINNTICYLECKTYNIENIDSSFRAFYLSPSEESKIIADAYHLLVSFEIEEENRAGGKVFVPVHWRLYSLETMRLQIKHEFNASNREMYTRDALLMEDSSTTG